MTKAYHLCESTNCFHELVHNKNIHFCPNCGDNFPSLNHPEIEMIDEPDFDIYIDDSGFDKTTRR